MANGHILAEAFLAESGYCFLTSTPLSSDVSVNQAQLRIGKCSKDIVKLAKLLKIGRYIFNRVLNHC